MIIEEHTELAAPFNSWTPPYSYIHKKTITYDTDPIYEIQEMTDDGWHFEQQEVSYCPLPLYTVTMIRYTMDADSLEAKSLVVEVPIISPEEIKYQIYKLFDNKWCNI